MKSATPPDGVTTVLVGLAGRVGAGPRTSVGSGAVHTGVMSALVGAATLPLIWGGTDWA